MVSELVQEQVKRLPAHAGVYIMKDVAGTILYVGKATSLRDRVRSYFGSGEKVSSKIERLVSHVQNVEYILTNSEEEALLLEMNLVKQHRPRYNVRLKDDKAFPYLKITVYEDFPRICLTRRWERDGGKYFGPFTNTRSVRQTMKLIKRLFPARTCTKSLDGHDSCPCLEYHIKNCLGPCIGAVSKEDYRQLIKEVILFLEGKEETIVEEIRVRMNQASEALEFEKAAILRDQVQAIESVVEGQKIAGIVRGEQDIIAFASENDQAAVQVFFVRENKLIGRENFILQGVRSEEPSRIIGTFIKQFYDSSPYIPSLILLQHPAEDQDILQKWLSDRRGGKVSIEVPQQGGKKQLVQSAAENARHGLEQLKIRQLTSSASVEALAELEKELSLEGSPDRIEGYDVSNIQGTSAVGSMVVFENGKAKPADYRRFRIKTVVGANDYGMLQEVLRRRFKRLNDGDSADSWASLPDLILIDGGKGQLNAALEVLKEVGAGSLPVLGLAKEREEIFTPDRSEPIILPHNSAGLQLLQRVRDEAHRFAITYFKKVHKAGTFASVLDNVSGIGPRRKQALLRKFGSLDGIKKASEEELIAAGLNRPLARKLKEQLQIVG